MDLKKEIKEILTKYACDMCDCNCDDGVYPDLDIVDEEVNEVVELIMNVINDIPLMEPLK